MRVAGPGAESAERSHVDDAALRSAEMGQGFARDEKRAASVGFEHGVPLVEGEAFEGRGSKDGGVVDEDVEAAEAGIGFGDGWRTEVSERTSQGTARERRPRAAISAAVCAASDCEVRKVMATSAPAWARASAIARPRRRAPPVTRTVLPARGAVGITRSV